MIAAIAYAALELAALSLFIFAIGVGAILLN